MIELAYIKFIPRPIEDGLHDSGYRYIKLVGVDLETKTEYDLGEGHDHLIVDPPCNIDVEPDGTIRIMPWAGTKFYCQEGETGFFSTAWIHNDGEFT